MSTHRAQIEEHYRLIDTVLDEVAERQRHERGDAAIAEAREAHARRVARDAPVIEAGRRARAEYERAKAGKPPPRVTPGRPPRTVRPHQR